MTRHFSPAELRFLRNRVPIDRVIETLLGLADQNINGKLSFACPLCGGFDTGVNPAHNLARCFACRQNFNPIELVMHQLKIGFVDSVKWLKKRIPAAQAHQETSAGRGKTAHPLTIGDILSDIMPALSVSKTDAQSMESLVHRISRLEHQLNHLSRMINELRSSLDQ
jgi:DNA primase